MIYRVVKVKYCGGDGCFKEGTTIYSSSTPFNYTRAELTNINQAFHRAAQYNTNDEDGNCSKCKVEVQC